MSNKFKIILSVVGVVISTTLLVISTILAEEAVIGSAVATVLTIISVILIFVAISFAVKVDYETGVFECRKCGHTFKPTFKAYVWGAHSLTTRHLKCPKCEEKSWCKRKMTKAWLRSRLLYFLPFDLFVCTLPACDDITLSEINT